MVDRLVQEPSWLKGKHKEVGIRSESFFDQRERSPTAPPPEPKHVEIRIQRKDSFEAQALGSRHEDLLAGKTHRSIRILLH